MIRQMAFGLMTLSFGCLVLELHQGDGKKELGVPKQISDENANEVRLLAYSPKLKIIASVPGIYNFRPGQNPALPIYVWDVTSGARKHVLVGHHKIISYLTFTADGKELLSGANDGLILWDPIHGTADNQRYKGISPGTQIAPSGKDLFNRDAAGNIVVLDEPTHKNKRVLEKPKELKEGVGGSPVISLDERFIAMGGGMGNTKIVVWDYKLGSFKAIINHTSQIQTLTFCNTSSYLFAGGNEIRKDYLGKGVLEIWDTKLWKQIHQIEMDEFDVLPILYLPKEDIVLSVDSLRLPQENGNNGLFKTLVNGYSVKDGTRVLTYDTQLAKSGYCTSAIYLDDINVICIGGADGKISFFSVTEILNHKRKERAG